MGQNGRVGRAPASNAVGRGTNYHPSESKDLQNVYLLLVSGVTRLRKGLRGQYRVAYWVSVLAGIQ